jgi:hypothetical protein
MVPQLSCPVCGSEDVYSLLNTLHCKRCGNIWTEEKKTRTTYDTHEGNALKNNRTWTPAVTESLETRMEKQLEGYLKKSRGKFSLYFIAPNLGDIHMAMFRRYLKKCVQKKTLIEKKDRYGIVWYSRPG